VLPITNPDNLTGPLGRGLLGHGKRTIAARWRKDRLG
jgi:hypothetical protein